MTRNHAFQVGYFSLHSLSRCLFFVRGSIFAVKLGLLLGFSGDQYSVTPDIDSVLVTPVLDIHVSVSMYRLNNAFHSSVHVCFSFYSLFNSRLHKLNE